MKVRDEGSRKSGERGARVTESIVEAYWESANSPGFNLTGEPWTHHLIYRRARNAAARQRLELLQRNRQRKTSTKQTATLSRFGGNEGKSAREREKEKNRKCFRYSILVELSPASFRLAWYLAASADSLVLFPVCDSHLFFCLSLAHPFLTFVSLFLSCLFFFLFSLVL